MDKSAAGGAWRGVCTVAIVVASLLLGACDDDGPTRTPLADSSGGFALPRAIGELRSVDPNRLTAILFVDGEPVVAERRGTRWVASFDVDDAASIQVEWRYEIGTRTLVIARSASVRVSRDDPSRSIVVDDYDTASFDADQDGIDNLTEVNAGTDPFVANEGVRTFTVTLDVPPSIAGAVGPDELSPRLELDGEPVALDRDGDRWTGRLVIDDDLTHRFVVTWGTVYEGVELILARSGSIAFNRDSSPSALTVSEYDSSFDDDDDGVSNVREIAQGRDPLVADGPPALVPGPGQRDCREYRDPSVPPRDQEAERDVFVLSDSGTDTLLYSPDAGRRYFFATLYTERSGVVTLAHVGGLPEFSVSLLYDTGLDVNDPEEQFRLLAVSEAVNERASVTAELGQGIYCYVLSADVGGGESFVGDLVLSLEFEPR